MLIQGKGPNIVIVSPSVLLQEPQVLVTLLLPDDHDSEHDRDTEGGGGVQSLEGRFVTRRSSLVWVKSAPEKRMAEFSLASHL